MAVGTPTKEGCEASTAPSELSMLNCHLLCMSPSLSVLHCRRSCANVRGSVGLPTPGTAVVVVDPVTHCPLPDGQQGLVLAAGPGVMAGGYLGDQDATQRAFIDGWFDTGDLQLLVGTAARTVG